MSDTNKDRTVFGKDFWTGFKQGISSPSLVYAPLKVKRDPRFGASVRRAWVNVGDAFAVAVNAEEASSIDQKKHVRHRKQRKNRKRKLSRT